MTNTTELTDNSPETLQEASLRRRDWILLSMLSFLTIGLVLGSTEWIARRIFPKPETSTSRCIVTNDRSTGVRGIPNAVCQDRLAESAPIELRFNNCGHRAGMPCGPKPPGTYRIVMVGSSYAMGLGVQQKQTFAALLPSELSRKTGRSIEVYNESFVWEVPRVVSMRLNDVLTAQPDLILWVLTAWDIENPSVVLPEDLSPNAGDQPAPIANNNAGTRTGLLQRVKGTIDMQSLRSIVRDYGRRTQTLLLLRHFLWESQSQFVNDSLRGESAGFLMTRQDTHWQNSVHQFDGYAAEIEARANEASIPLVAVLLPQRAHAAMISMGEWPDGFDPYKMDTVLRSIIVSHGGIYLDILPDFRSIPNPEQYYFPVDGHPYASGHAIFARLIADKLTNGAIPALKTSTQPDVALEQSR